MGKNIVVCYDGTNKEYGTDNTNVVKAFQEIVRDDAQVAFYDPGVGTFSFLGRRFGRWFGVMMGSAFGYGIRQNIEDGYEYLMNTFQPDDRVFIFGFSRGAYTARALTGMIHYVGILPKGSKNLLPYASKLYFRIRKEGKTSVHDGFKCTFSQKCKPHFIGIWDTVAALGPNLSRRFPNLMLSPDVKHGFHAIAIDEKRWPYSVKCWDESGKGGNQVIEQLWFAGGHSDVGGGCRNDERGLSDIAFAWMMDNARKCGLRLRADWRDRLRQKPLEKMHNGWGVWIWYLLPVVRRLPDGARMWPVVSRLWSIVLRVWLYAPKSKHRPEVQPRVHKSVIDRMEHDSSYRPVLPEGHLVASTVSYKKPGRPSGPGHVETP